MEADDYLPLSGLQHLAFCERQCALIHVEGVWAENRLTVEGRHLHRKVDETGDEIRDGVRVVRGLWLRSDRLKLTGKADVVEFRPEGPWPVEYKRGVRKQWLHDEVQLCAQALCLEEMMGVRVDRGSLYYGSSKRRREVVFDESLRARVEASAHRYHDLVRRRVLPAPINDSRCRNCSLRESCMPSIPVSAREYLRSLAKGSDS